MLGSINKYSYKQSPFYLELNDQIKIRCRTKTHNNYNVKMKYGEIELKVQNIYQHWEINDSFYNYSCGPSKPVQLISITKALLRDELGLH